MTLCWMQGHWHILVTECDDGTYGYNCVNNCSGDCLNDYPCNKQTGNCDRGCSPGYTGDKCRKSNAILLINVFCEYLISCGLITLIPVNGDGMVWILKFK